MRSVRWNPDYSESELDGEVWKPVLGFEDTHEVSNLGRVRSRREINTMLKGAACISRGTIFKGQFNKGRIRYRMTYGHRTTYRTAELIVATAFIPNPDTNKYREVGHKDGNTQNNRASNLFWEEYKPRSRKKDKDNGDRNWVYEAYHYK